MRKNRNKNSNYKKPTSFAACARLTALTFHLIFIAVRPAHLAPLVIYRKEYMIE